MTGLLSDTIGNTIQTLIQNINSDVSEEPIEKFKSLERNNVVKLLM